MPVYYSVAAPPTPVTALGGRGNVQLKIVIGREDQQELNIEMKNMVVLRVMECAISEELSLYERGAKREYVCSSFQNTLKTKL